MKIQMKKLLSVFLVTVMLFSTLIPVFALSDVNVTFHTNGGQFKDSVKNGYNSGEALPGYEEIERDGLIFAGWYDNSALTGLPLYSVPTGTTGDVTYYAKWVESVSLTYNFDNMSWVNWSLGTTISANNDAANAYSGSTSMKYEITAGSQGIMCANSGLMYEGDGVYFWIKAERPTTVYLQFSASGSKVTEAVTVNAGKNFVALPWPATVTPDGNGWAGSVQIMTTPMAEANTVYVDNVGTYKNLTPVSFELNGGSFSKYAPLDYYVGMPLPNYEKIANGNCIFAGWYDNAEFTGAPMLVVPDNATGAKTYYAKWVKTNTLTYNFDNMSWVNWSVGTTISANNDAANAYSGSTSMKYEISANSQGIMCANSGLMLEGDGVYFWIKSEKKVNVFLQFKANGSIVTEKVTIPAGKSFVALPWPATATPDGNGWAGSVQIMTDVTAEDNIVYVDDVGTYKELGGELSFELGGGHFINEAPAEYTPGMTLPNYEAVSNGNLIFAGWYDNSQLTGTPVYVVPSDATEALTYYAKWVESVSLTYNFDNMNWVDWALDTTISANNDMANAFSGSSSMKYEIPADKLGMMCANSGLMFEGEGVYFWIKAEKSATIHLQFKANGSIVTEKVTVSAGKNFVVLPWPANVVPDGNGWAGSIQIVVSAASYSNTVYIDDVGVYKIPDQNTGNESSSEESSSEESSSEESSSEESSSEESSSEESSSEESSSETSSELDNTDITFEIGSGQFVTTPPTEYTSGMILPGYEAVSNGNLIFAGWYDNASLLGTPVYFVPADASGALTYYAKWVESVSLTYNFDNMNWVDWAADTAISANNNAANAFSGSTSMKYEIPANKLGMMCANSGLMFEGDGVYFWIKAEKAATLHLQFSANGSIVTEKVTVSAGKNFVALPWPSNITPDGNGWAGSVQIVVASASYANTVHIDDVGTYTEDISTPEVISPIDVTFVLDGGKFVNGTPAELYAGSALPNYEQIAKDGYVFAGWYDNAGYKGVPVYFVSDNANGTASYYAKWVKNYSITYNFDTMKWVDWAVDTTISANNDAANAFSGSTSLKYEIPANKMGMMATNEGLMYEGDGVYFWIKAEKSATVYLQFKASGLLVTEKVVVSAGKNIIALPWPKSLTPNEAGWAGSVQIVVAASSEPNTVYIDDVGTYIASKNIQFKLNGGEFVNTIPNEYFSGMVLPNYESVTKENLLFAGWYDNCELNGNAVYTIPFDLDTEKTYYAKWVLGEVTGDDFESYKDKNTVSVDKNGALSKDTDMINNNNLCYYWSGNTKGTAQLNTNKSHLYSGKKSVKLSIPKIEDFGNESWRNKTHFAIPNHSVDGDGVYFWIETEKAATVRVMFQYQGAKANAISIPAGKHLIIVPWSSVTGDIWGKQMLVEVSHGNENNTVYLDEFGTYENVAVQDDDQMGIEFVLGGGTFKGYNAPSNYYPKMPLPTYENVVMEGHTFAGWYDNAGFQGLPTFFVPADTKGNKVYYARWVDCDSSFETFEDYKGDEEQDAQNFWASWTLSGEISLNTKASNAFSGKKSMKVSVKNRQIHGDDRVDLVLDRDIHRDGDGVYFWIKTEVATQVWMRFNFTQSTQGFTTSKIDIHAGNNLVMIPWDEIPEADVRNLWWLVEINVATPALAGTENTIYIDDVGTFEDYVQNKITLNLNGGDFTDGYTAPLGYYTKGGFKLPTSANLVKDGFAFAGWYANAEFKGNPVSEIYAGSTGDKTYYARWVIHDVNVENFENGLGEGASAWQDWSGNANLELGSYPNNFKFASNGLKYVTSGVKSYIYVANREIRVNGDGISFRLNTEKEVVLKVRLDHCNSTVLESSWSYVAAGDRLVTIPWSDITDTDKDMLSSLEIQLKTVDEGNTCYIDDIGTYTEDPAEAKDIVYKTNGGKFVDGYAAPSSYATGGVFLPESKFIVRLGYIFMGWYDNAEFEGKAIKVIPTDSKESVTYYARWVKPNELYDDFEINLGSGSSQWQDWTGNSDLSLNTDADNSYNQSNSMKYVASGTDSYIYVTDREFTVNGTGISFWIKSEKAASLRLRLDHYNPTTLESGWINIPAGESFVTIPWSEITDTDKSALKSLEFQIITEDAGNVYYIDYVGTYLENVKYSITYNVDSAEWIGSYKPVTEYSDAGVDLPNYTNIKYTAIGNMSFIGWCENADLSDEPVLTIPAGTEGDKVFYPKWAIVVADYDNFEGYKTAEDINKVWFNTNKNVVQFTINTDKANLNHGSTSMKLQLNKYASVNDTSVISNRTTQIYKTGEGIVLWISAKRATSIKLRFNYETFTNPGVTTSEKYVPAGCSYITVSWDEIGLKSIKRLDIMVSAPSTSDTNTVYIDSIGTYHSFVGLDINYTLNGGSFNDASSVIYDRSPLDNVILPSGKDISYDGYIFAGWYDNKNFDGAPVYVLLPGATGINLWAKWVQQDKLNHTFDNFADTQTMLQAEWSDYRGFEGWRENGGSTLTLNTNTLNTSKDSLKSLQVNYCVPDGEYIAGGEASAALFKNYSWSTTFGARSTSKEGDGIRFWIKSDRTITFSVVFSKAWLDFSYMPRITIPANTPVEVYLPWSALNNGGFEAYNLYEAGFEIYDSVGASGTVWIDDLGVYFNEKIVDFVYEHSDKDIKIYSYNNHVPKNTIADIKKYSEKYLIELGGKVPEGATLNYTAEYSLTSPTGGAAEISGPIWISFKLPKGVDTGKIGVYEFFFDGSLMSVNYTIEGEWVTICTINPMGSLMVTTNDTNWIPRGPSIADGVVQPLTVTVTKPVEKPDADESKPEEIPENNSSEETSSENSSSEDSSSDEVVNKRPPKREPLGSDNGVSDWIVIAAISAGLVVLAGTVTTLLVIRRRIKKTGGAK